MLSVPREKYPEMDRRADDKVAAWMLFKCHMKVIFMADHIPKERQCTDEPCSIILVRLGKGASKMVISGKLHVPSPRMHSFGDTKIQGQERCTGPKPGSNVEVSDGEQHSLEEPSATTGKEAHSSKMGKWVLSGPNKKITDIVKAGPFHKVYSN